MKDGPSPPARAGGDPERSPADSRQDLAEHLLKTRVLAGSTGWSLGALLVPTVVGFVTVPWIVRGFGDERFGVLALAWTLIGYLGVFDFGLGRALTKLVAESLGDDELPKFGRLVWSALELMAALGLVGGAVLAIVGPWLLLDLVGVPPELGEETRAATYFLAVSLPMVVLSAAFRGILDATQKFGLSTVVRLPLGVANFVAPAVLLFFTRDLAVHIAALVVIRAAALVAFAVLALRAVGLGAPQRFDVDAARRLFGFGAWITISNVVSPIMVSLDRFFVGGLISVVAVTFYAAPFDAITRVLMIPGSITSVLFPAFSTAAVRSRERLLALFWGGTDVVFYAVYPVMVVAMFFAPELLRVWLGQAFAEQSTTVLRWLSIGVVANSVASVPYAFVQGMGRSDLTAKLHLAEAPAYVVAVVWLAESFGIGGVALAWSLRTTADMLLLFWLAGLLSGGSTRASLRRLTVPLLAILLMASGLIVEPLPARIAISTAAIAGLAVLVWSRLGRARRAQLLRFLMGLARPPIRDSG